MPRSQSARRRALLQLAGTVGEGAGANGGRAALDGMQGRGAALDIALAELAFELGEEVLHIRNEAPQHLDDQLRLPPKRPTISPAPRPVRPRPLSLPAPPVAAPAEMTEQTKHQALLVDRLRHMVVHARRQAASRSASEALAVMARIGSPAKRPSARIRRVASRPSISGICMSISTASNSTLASSTLLNARQPTVGEGHPGALAAQQLGGDLAVQRVVLHYQQTHAPGSRWVRSTRRGGGLAEAPCAPCRACSTESASCLGVTGLVRKSTKGGALWSRASASTSRP